MSAEHTEDGYIRAYRSLFDNSDAFWQAGRPHSYWEAWLYILSLCHYKSAPARVLVHGHLVTVQRGEFLISQRTLAERMGWTRNQVRTFLKTLEKLTRITPAASPTLGHHKVCNYETYNPSALPGPPTISPSPAPPQHPHFTHTSPTLHPIQERKEGKTPEISSLGVSGRNQKPPADPRIAQCITAFYEAFKGKHGKSCRIQSKDAAQVKRLIAWLDKQGEDAAAEFVAHLDAYLDDEWVLTNSAASLSDYCSRFNKWRQRPYAGQASRSGPPDHHLTLEEIQQRRRAASGH